MNHSAATRSKILKALMKVKCRFNNCFFKNITTLLHSWSPVTIFQIF